MNVDAIFAPWSPEEVAALNRWQATPTVHPFTCGGDHDGDRDLVARVDGWHCPTCGYKQTWAHRSMLNTPPTTVRV